MALESQSLCEIEYETIRSRWDRLLKKYFQNLSQWPKAVYWRVTSVVNLSEALTCALNP